MKAFILSIGDELVLGQTVDTNSAWISQQLSAVGCDIAGHQTVGDDQAMIEHAIMQAGDVADVLIISGGIGPTEDDLTRQSIARVMNVPLELNNDWLTHLQAFFTNLGRVMPDSNKIQAMIPRGAAMLWNTCGTAAGLHAVLSKEKSRKSKEQSENKQERVESKDETVDENVTASASGFSLSSLLSPLNVFAMPGVPKEMKAMFARDVLPWIKQRCGGAVILQKTLHTFGAGESTVAELIGPLMMRQRNPSVGTTVAAGLVSLRINARFDSLEQATREMNDTVALCREKLGDRIFGEDGKTLPQAVAELILNHRTIDKQFPSIATVESCTGGLLAKMFTDLPGSSHYFKQGWVTYANTAKQDCVDVDMQLIETHGAVSEAVACAMAAGGREKSGATYALSITGIAGPDGGTPDKPVGTVWVGFSHAGGTVAHKFIIPGDRETIRDRSAKTALNILRYHLLNKPMPM
jgi:nicotinamide-nucleotide amidase